MAFAGMKERRWGRIINISSAQGLIASCCKLMDKAAFVDFIVEASAGSTRNPCPY